MFGEDRGDRRMLCRALLKLSSMAVNLFLACARIFSARSLSNDISSSVLVPITLFLLLSASSILSSGTFATSAASLSFMILDVSKFSQSPSSEPVLEEEWVLSLRDWGVGEGGSEYAMLSMIRLFLDMGVSSSPISLSGAPCS